MKATRDDVLRYLLEVMQSMRDEWDDREVVSEDSMILGNVNWRSIEIVYLARAVQQQFGQVIPFQEFLHEMKERGDKDFSVRELVDFIYDHLHEEAQSELSGSVTIPELSS